VAAPVVPVEHAVVVEPGHHVVLDAAALQVAA
jgi:hypothetical protein